MSEQQSGAQTVMRAATVLKLIGRFGGARFSVLARETGLANATLRRLLLSLVESNLVAHDKSDALYKLGSEAYLLGLLAKPEFGFHDLARDSLARLADSTGDTACLSAVDGLSTVCLQREDGQFPIRTHLLKVGDRHPLGLGATSSAILAELPEQVVTDILATTADDVRAIREDLDLGAVEQMIANARVTGIGLNPGLVFPGSWAMAAAIRSPSGGILGALTLAAIESRMDAERQPELSEALLREARRIESLLARFGTGGLRLGEPV